MLRGRVCHALLYGTVGRYGMPISMPVPFSMFLSHGEQKTQFSRRVDTLIPFGQYTQWAGQGTLHHFQELKVKIRVPIGWGMGEEVGGEKTFVAWVLTFVLLPRFSSCLLQGLDLGTTNFGLFNSCFPCLCLLVGLGCACYCSTCGSVGGGIAMGIAIGGL